MRCAPAAAVLCTVLAGSAGAGVAIKVAGAIKTTGTCWYDKQLTMANVEAIRTDRRVRLANLVDGWLDWAGMATPAPHASAVAHQPWLGTIPMQTLLPPRFRSGPGA
jgi:hypothetical protein